LALQEDLTVSLDALVIDHTPHEKRKNLFFIANHHLKRPRRLAA